MEKRDKLKTLNRALLEIQTSGRSLETILHWKIQEKTAHCLVLSEGVENKDSVFVL